ncbi:unnamed protein product [Prorocentrum cordatum]|nr:unnamed protein product [Polarella glacialis]
MRIDAASPGKEAGPSGHTSADLERDLDLPLAGAGAAARTLALASGLLGKELDVTPSYWPAVWQEFGDEAVSQLLSRGTKGEDEGAGAKLQWQARVLRRLRELMDDRPPKGDAEESADAGFQEHLQAAEFVLRRAAHAVSVLQTCDEGGPARMPHLEKVVPRVCADLASWLEQMTTLVSVYHVSLHDMESERRRLQAELSAQVARAGSAEREAHAAGSRLERVIERRQEEETQAKADQLLGRNAPGAAWDDEAWEAKLDELHRKWEEQYMQPVLQEMEDLKSQNMELLDMLRKSNREKKEVEDLLSKAEAFLKASSLRDEAQAQGMEALEKLLESLDDDCFWAEGRSLLQESLEYLRSGDDSHQVAIQGLLRAGCAAAAEHGRLSAACAHAGRALRAVGGWLAEAAAAAEGLAPEVGIGNLAPVLDWAVRAMSASARGLGGPRGLGGGGSSPGATSPQTPQGQDPAYSFFPDDGDEEECGRAGPGGDSGGALGQAGEFPWESLGCGEPSRWEPDHEAPARVRRQVEEEVRVQMQAQVAGELERLRLEMAAQASESAAITERSRRDADEMAEKLREDLEKARGRIDELRKKLTALQKILEKRGLGKEMREAMEEAGLTTFQSGANRVFERLYGDATARLHKFTERQVDYIRENSTGWQNKCKGAFERVLDQVVRQKEQVAPQKSELGRAGQMFRQVVEQRLAPRAAAKNEHPTPLQMGRATSAPGQPRRSHAEVGLPKETFVGVGAGVDGLVSSTSSTGLREQPQARALAHGLQQFQQVVGRAAGRAVANQRLVRASGAEHAGAVPPPGYLDLFGNAVPTHGSEAKGQLVKAKPRRGSAVHKASTAVHHLGSVEEHVVRGVASLPAGKGRGSPREARLGAAPQPASTEEPWEATPVLARPADDALHQDSVGSALARRLSTARPVAAGSGRLEGGSAHSRSASPPASPELSRGLDGLADRLACGAAGRRGSARKCRGSALWREPQELSAAAEFVTAAAAAAHAMPEPAASEGLRTWPEQRLPQASARPRQLVSVDGLAACEPLAGGLSASKSLTSKSSASNDESLADGGDSQDSRWRHGRSKSLARMASDQQAAIQQQLLQGARPSRRGSSAVSRTAKALDLGGEAAASRAGVVRHARTESDAHTESKVSATGASVAERVPDSRASQMLTSSNSLSSTLRPSSSQARHSRIQE